MYFIKSNVKSEKIYNIPSHWNIIAFALMLFIALYPVKNANAACGAVTGNFINPCSGYCPLWWHCDNPAEHVNMGQAGAFAATNITSYNGMIPSFRNAIIKTINETNCGSNPCPDDNLTYINQDSDVTHKEFANWLRDDFWYASNSSGDFDAGGKGGIGTALRNMVTQILNNSYSQIAIIGTFFDAESHINREFTLQKLRSESHHKYVPSRQLCIFATGVKSLAYSEQKAKITKYAMAKESIERQLGGRNSTGHNNDDFDKKVRMAQFRNKYCDISDNSWDMLNPTNTNGLTNICNANVQQSRINKDVNFTKTLYTPKTLNIDYGINDLEEDEEDIIALARNLYAHDIMPTIDKSKLDYKVVEDTLSDLRSMITKRSVAENSFYNLASIKSSGSPAGAINLRNIIASMSDDASGALMNDDEITKLIGENPSYYAQMEILTKKLYQNPNFYIGLIDKPANIDRQKAAMKSFELMQGRDIYESILRSEMILSVIVEQRLRLLQKDATDILRGVK